MDPTVNIHIKRTKKIVKAVLNEQELTLIFKGAYLLYQKYEDRKPKDGKTALYKWLAARDWAIISLLICTGIRKKEIMSIDVDSIDLQNRVIKIQGKGDLIHHIRERIIPITEPVVLASLETYIKLRPKSLFPELFLSARFEPLLANGFECVVKKIMSEILPEKSLNITKIRRSYISLCAEKGVDPMVLKQIMGHHSLATTMKYYLTVRQQYLKEVWEKNNPLNCFTNEECEKWII
jgi:site-specific recombinase XerD